MELEEYEGALDIERAWREGLVPDPLLSVSEWSDRHRMLSSKASREGEGAALEGRPMFSSSLLWATWMGDGGTGTTLLGRPLLTGYRDGDSGGGSMWLPLDGAPAIGLLVCTGASWGGAG